MTSRHLLSPFTDEWDQSEEFYVLAQVRYAQFRSCTMEEIQEIPLWRHRNNANSIAPDRSRNQLF